MVSGHVHEGGNTSLSGSGKNSINAFIRASSTVSVIYDMDHYEIVWGKGRGGSSISKTSSALAGMAQWTECWPTNQRVASPIPSQGTCLGCRPGPQ